MGERTSDRGVLEGENGGQAGKAESGDHDWAMWAALSDVYYMEECCYVWHQIQNSALGGAKLTSNPE